MLALQYRSAAWKIFKGDDMLGSTAGANSQGPMAMQALFEPPTSGTLLFVSACVSSVAWARAGGRAFVPWLGRAFDPWQRWWAEV